MSTVKLRLGQEGTLQLPADLLLEMGVGPGDELLVVGAESKLLLGQCDTANTPWRRISHELIEQEKNSAA
ncbi:MAG: AbrB/MazE/SpoVT family DNA-binding domain-containing protein [Xanthomonadales bacterium]|nr:AbrB/MazE/SpoVT family DNA-binding domain-containing protein [Xanthomonadales bacterium]